MRKLEMWPEPKEHPEEEDFSPFPFIPDYVAANKTRCGVCGGVIKDILYSFCPFCGASLMGDIYTPQPSTSGTGSYITITTTNNTTANNFILTQPATTSTAILTYR